jgi:prephenate dehydratase
MRPTAYLGPEATFTEEAARRLCGPDAPLQPRRGVLEVLRAVESGEAAHGIVPIENRLEGGVTATLDALADDVDLLVEAEIDVAVELVAAGPPGTVLADVTAVRSHPVGLAACRRWLADILPAAELQHSSSTAQAAADVATHGGTAIAIANRLAVERHGLAVVAEGIADVAGNRTRFVQVGRTIPARTGWDKTSLVVYIPDNRPGALLALLEAFAERELDLTKIESRPTKHELGDYRFFVDVEGHIDDERVADALAALKRTMRDVKLLGSYPRLGERPDDGHDAAADDASFVDAAAWVRAWRDRVEPPRG